MDGRTIAERYVTLCLRAGEHAEDLVDAYIGPESLKKAALAGGLQDAEALRDEALSLLEDAPRADLEDDRVEWLLGQLRALECITAMLAGDEVSWSDEVEACFGIRPAHVDEEVFRASHRRLDGVLPGNGDVAARYNAWLEDAVVPGDLLPRATGALAEWLRARTAEMVELPAGESVEWKTVADVPWQAFNWYRGALRSVVEINLDLPLSVVDVVAIVAHEAYPGHHTERACKETLLYRGKGRLETSVMILSGPEAVISEGIATNALDVALGTEGFAALRDVGAGAGLGFDPEVAGAVYEEEARLFAAAANVARMLDEDGLAPAGAESYLQEWSLHSPERAAKTVAFVTDPGSRAYATAYTDGRDLCRSFIDRVPDGFRRLLTEQLTVTSLSSP